MLVRVNPDRLKADPKFRVDHPDSKRAFPSPDTFELSAPDLANPRVLRLLPQSGQPGGVAGGVFGDLVLVESPAKKSAR